MPFVGDVWKLHYRVVEDWIQQGFACFLADDGHLQFAALCARWKLDGVDVLHKILDNRLFCALCFDDKAVVVVVVCGEASEEVE